MRQSKTSLLPRKLARLNDGGVGTRASQLPRPSDPEPCYKTGMKGGKLYPRRTAANMANVGQESIAYLTHPRLPVGPAMERGKLTRKDAGI